MHVIEMFDRSVRHFPERLAFSGSGGEFTYREAQMLSYRIANAMLRDGMGKDTRFAFLSPNDGLAMLSMLGSMRANAVWCNLNLRDTPDRIVDLLRRGGVELVFYNSVVSELVPLMRDKLENLKGTICLDSRDENGVYLQDWIEATPSSKPDISYHEDDFGMQACTGGTTGEPKLALSTHRWFSSFMLSLATSVHFSQPPVYLSVAPITHGGGAAALYTLTQGGTVVMMAQPDPDSILKAIEEKAISLMFLPPTLTYVLLKHPRVRDYDYGTLKYIISSAAPIASEKISEAIEIFGPVLAQTYGQAETGPLTFMSPQEYQEALRDHSKQDRLASCGRQCITVESLEIVDEDDNPLPANERGEIVMRGPGAMHAYVGDKDATADIQRNGWHHTGDIGYRDDDGYIYVVDRKRDMIVSGGFNIFPFEIEQVLLGHPAVQDCAVIGVPDDKWGEAVKAVVVLSPGVSATEEELLAHCRQELGGMKTPKSVDFSDELPRSAVGKTLKRALREKYWRGQKRQVH
jgi:acyl-CoA synthetase (AMP-forming)/AMP-acid ligase II